MTGKLSPAGAQQTCCLLASPPALPAAARLPAGGLLASLPACLPLHEARHGLHDELEALRHLPLAPHRVCQQAHLRQVQVGLASQVEQEVEVCDAGPEGRSAAGAQVCLELRGACGWGAGGRGRVAGGGVGEGAWQVAVGGIARLASWQQTAPEARPMQKP